ncbi:hypothetical protein E3N88_18626 [Mikania micrantha]|uniref:Uncharacterized protein n=1 Tax=Mikania micrantha TaxID=192012 RepID=A0A5N6NMN0_9ASTR|nr:hypothetical protein E3N88_18626 [Mikania micrantha]
MFSEKQGRGRKVSWSKSSVSSEEPGRNSGKKISEASASDSRKKQDKKGVGKKVSEASTSDNQKKKASEKNVSEDQERKASEGKRTSEEHAKKASYISKKYFPFRRRRTSEVKPNLSAKTKSSEGKSKGASDNCQKKQTLLTTLKVKQIWKKKEITEPSVQPPVQPTTNSSSVPSKMMLKKFTYNDANGKPKTTWAWVPIRN